MGARDGSSIAKDSDKQRRLKKSLNSKEIGITTKYEKNNSSIMKPGIPNSSTIRKNVINTKHVFENDNDSKWPDVKDVGIKDATVSRKLRKLYQAMNKSLNSTLEASEKLKQRKQRI